MSQEPKLTADAATRSPEPRAIPLSEIRAAIVENQIPQMPLWARVHRRVRRMAGAAGEWMGLTGSKATLVSRLTVVAVGLVLVSGLSLLLCPEDGPTPAPGLSEVELAADMVPAPSLRSPDLEPADDVIHANAEQGDAASGSDLTQSVAWENSPQRNVRRGVWLEGTIEIE